MRSYGRLGLPTRSAAQAREYPAGLPCSDTQSKLTEDNQNLKLHEECGLILRSFANQTFPSTLMGVAIFLGTLTGTGSIVAP